MNMKNPKSFVSRGKLFCLLSAGMLSISSARAAQLAFFDFETGSGSVVDLEPVNGGDNTGSLAGGATYSANVPSTTPSLSLSSLALDGDGDYVDLANPGAMLTGASGFTLAAFVNVTELPSVNFDSVIFISRGTENPNQARALLQVGSNGQIGVGGRRDDINSLARYQSANGLVTTGVWHHIAATVDFSSGNAVVTLYFNGAPVSHSLESSGQFSPGTAISSTNSLLARIGANGAGNGEFFHGFVDDVRIYDHVLNPGEIAALMIPEPSASLLAFTGFALLVRRRR